MHSSQKQKVFTILSGYGRDRKKHGIRETNILMLSAAIFPMLPATTEASIRCFYRRRKQEKHGPADANSVQLPCAVPFLPRMPQLPTKPRGHGLCSEATAAPIQNKITGAENSTTKTVINAQYMQAGMR